MFLGPGAGVAAGLVAAAAAGMPAPKQPDSGTLLPPEWEVFGANEDLPSPGKERWVVLSSSDGAGLGPLSVLTVDAAVVASGFALLSIGDRIAVARVGKDDSALDARVLAIRESPVSGRHLNFRDGVLELTGRGETLRDGTLEERRYGSDFGHWHE